MDLQKIITSLFIGVGILTLNANRTGVPQAVTGAPGESGFSCNACHNGGNFNTNIGLKIMETDSNVVSQYTPGEEYILEIDVNGQNNPKSFGFQLVALDSMQNDMSQWKLTGDQVRQINLLNRRYLVQSSAKASGKFYVNWTAPSDYNGHVEFYYSGLAVNLNGNTSGDSHATGKRSFPSDAISSISSTLPYTTLIYPNPTYDELFTTSQEKQALIFNTIGHIWTVEVLQQRVDIRDLPPGQYWIRFSNRTDSFIKR